jgi:hypothetical protein
MLNIKATTLAQVNIGLTDYQQELAELTAKHDDNTWEEHAWWVQIRHWGNPEAHRARQITTAIDRLQTLKQLLNDELIVRIT